MSVKIKTDFGNARVDGGRWVYASNPMMKTLLIGIDKERLDDEMGYHPHPDLGLAEMAISLLGGSVTEVVDAPKFVEGRIY